jgi:exodeoxyribonuclease VII large subunit
MRQTLGYRETLKRGYAVVRGDGAVVTTTLAAQAAERLEVEFMDGKLEIGGATTPEISKKSKPKSPQSDSGSDQGSLF